MARTLAAGALGSMLLAASFGAEAADPKSGGALVFARPDEPLTLDPFIPADNGSIWAIEQVCDTLVEADETGEGLISRAGGIMGGFRRRLVLHV